jgi:hypothetical protein
VSWLNLLDVTGDGRPDLVFQNGNQLMVARNRPGGGASTTLSSSVPLSGGEYTGRPLASYSSKLLRYDDTFQNVGNVWRPSTSMGMDGSTSSTPPSNREFGQSI